MRYKPGPVSGEPRLTAHTWPALVAEALERERYIRQAYELDLQAEPTLKAKQSLLFCRLNCQRLQGEQLCLEGGALGSALSNRYDGLVAAFGLVRREWAGFRSVR